MHSPRSIRAASWWSLVALVCLPGLLPGREEKPARLPRFESDILPLFQAKCLRCHGEKVRKADLDLRTPEAILKGGESGPAVVPGKPDQSPLYEKVHTGTMPPARRDRLREEEMALIRRWIEAGAKPRELALSQHDSLPILLRRCTVCHGSRRREGGLDLRTRSAMLRGGKSGPAMVPGKPDASLLLKRIHAGDMPPRKRLVEVSVKPIEPAETEVLTKWIAQGAPEAEATPEPNDQISASDRNFWAFRTPQAGPVPVVRHREQLKNPVDAFILRELEARGLRLAPAADPLTLLRRVHLDLTGLPPTPQEIRDFAADRSGQAYEKVVDRLLASPRYGERWGRHWLDLAGYADSEGKREQDLERPHAWRYRDYVIQAFNADKPYDRFLREQIAGDELANYEKADTITPEIYDNLVATGFLRMAPDATWANITGFLHDRLEVIADEIDVLGSGVMGLTLKCARCHSHKFDPITQRDYYRLADIFKGAYDEHDWLKPDVRPGIGPVSQDVLGGRLLPHVTTQERKAWEARNASRKKGTPPLPEPRIQALWDRGDPSPTYLYRRGDPLNPGQLVQPGVPTVLSNATSPFVVKPPWPGAKKTGRRLAFARWLTDPNHPLTARVMVNRIWKHHLGTGIVHTLGNFGKAGSRPSHPQLLDWLAVEFVRQGWSVKKLHRLILTSATYRQSSAVTPEQQRLDPGNALYSRMPLTRLDAEALYDTLLFVAGRLDLTPFGPGDRVQARADGLVTPVGNERGWRRLLYVQQTRKRLPTHLENFDYPQMNPNCLERKDSTVAPQALHLMNNGMVRRLAEDFARRLALEAGPDPARQIELAYLIALSRPPTAEEMQVAKEGLTALTERWARNLPATSSPAQATDLARASFCHMLLNSAGLLYVD